MDFELASEPKHRATPREEINKDKVARFAFQILKQKEIMLRKEDRNCGRSTPSSFLLSPESFHQVKIIWITTLLQDIGDGLGTWANLAAEDGFNGRLGSIRSKTSSQLCSNHQERLLH